MKLIEVIPYLDYVIIEGQRVNRPQSIPRSAWLAYWEKQAA
jgi:hypothetical protein